MKIIFFCIVAWVASTMLFSSQSIGRQVMEEYELAAQRAVVVNDRVSACVNYMVAFEAALKDLPDHVNRLSMSKNQYCK